MKDASEPSVMFPFVGSGMSIWRSYASAHYREWFIPGVSVRLLLSPIHLLLELPSLFLIRK